MDANKDPPRQSATTGSGLHSQKSCPSTGGYGGWEGGSHLSEVTLQPAYRAPKLLLWNNGPSWRGRRGPVWSDPVTAPRRSHGKAGLLPGAA